MKVIVVGGGIGGLTAALSLHDRGFEVTLLEQSKEFGPVGVGLQLASNATRVLFQLGLGEELTKITTKPGGKTIRLWNTGQEWKLFDLGAEAVEKYGYPYLFIYRPDLHRILVDGLRKRNPMALISDARVVDVMQDEQSVIVTLEDGRTFMADALIGADGVHSVIRQKLVAEDHAEFSGFIAWRGAIPIEQAPALMRENKGVNWVGPKAHFTHYPIHAGKMLHFTGIVEKEGWYKESWTETGTVEECVRDFEGWHPSIIECFTQLEHPLRWAMMLRKPMTNWTNGRVTLLGDAAHPTLPFLAQGACMAIEDGCVIARALAAHPNDVNAAWTSYQNTRIDRTTKIVLNSAANTERFHNPKLADASGAAEYVDAEWEENKVRARYDWLFSYQPEQVALA